MKNPIKSMIKAIKKFFRRRAIKKREAVYDEVIEKLKPKVEEKNRKQKELIDTIIKQFPKDVGIYNGSKFIPATNKNEAEIYHTLVNKYGDQLEKNNLELTLNLEFRCI